MFTKAFRIGQEPQLRYTQKGDAVMGLSLAYNYGRKGEDGKKPTQWVEGSLWGKQAEALQPYLAKGGQIVATLDDLHIEEYEGKNGPGHKLVGRIVGLELVGGKPEGSSAPAQRQAAPSPRGGGASGFDDMDDDIPF
ncbi:MAG: single-stranded DNA-binding protein [Burkholderiales bacterium]